MKIKANGITINYQIDGPEHAPWLVFSNSLATSIAIVCDSTPPPLATITICRSLTGCPWCSASRGLQAE